MVTVECDLSRSRGRSGWVVGEEKPGSFSSEMIPSSITALVLYPRRHGMLEEMLAPAASGTVHVVG